jgi:hypothetical protein
MAVICRCKEEARAPVIVYPRSGGRGAAPDVVCVLMPSRQPCLPLMQGRCGWLTSSLARGAWMPGTVAGVGGVARDRGFSKTSCLVRFRKRQVNRLGVKCSCDTQALRACAEICAKTSNASNTRNSGSPSEIGLVRLSCLVRFQFKNRPIRPQNRFV